MKPEVVIIGGGLAGLFCSIQLAQAGFPVRLLEKKTYPFHRVCGEYLSNELNPFLLRLGFDKSSLGASSITRLQFNTGKRTFNEALGMGGFGISRYRLDLEVALFAKKMGVQILENCKALDFSFRKDRFNILLPGNKEIYSDLLIAAHGKRSVLDQKMERAFLKKRSPFVGIKYHIRTDFPNDTIRLDLFKGGYCGLVKIEEDKFCLCYMANREDLKISGSIPALEEDILFKNPSLKNLFRNSEFIYEKPEVINEISFSKKGPLEGHALFCGDSAGMIAPFCGNGMSMGIHSSYILAGLIKKNCKDIFNEKTRLFIEKSYKSKWNKEFSHRLAYGRMMQRLFSVPGLINLLLKAGRRLPVINRFLIEKTHGKGF